MKCFKIIFLFLIILSFANCNEGYVSSKEAIVLKKYLNPQELKILTENPQDDIWLIDVRPANLYDESHIPTAKSYPSNEIIKRVDELSKDKFLIIYCETGGRAQAVIKELEKKGYTKLMNWGGFTRWTY